MSYQLLREIRDALQDEVLAHVALRNPAVESETDADAFIQPRFYIGALPPKRKHGRENEDFPFVVIRMSSGQDGQDYSEITTEIICGVYTAEDEAGGTNDVQNIIDRIRNDFLRRRILGGVFELQLPLTWSVGSDQDRMQPHPYYIGQITAKWQTMHQAVLQALQDEMDVYGSGYK